MQKAPHINTTIVAHSVDTVVERDKPAPNRREQVVRILAELNVISAKLGKIFYRDSIDSSGLCVSDQSLDARTLKICSQIPIGFRPARGRTVTAGAFDFQC